MATIRIERRTIEVSWEGRTMIAVPVVWDGESTCATAAEGTVRVYDRIAGHYTICHPLSSRQQAAVVRLIGMGA